VENVAEVQDTVPPKVTVDINQQLIAPIEEKEVKMDLFQMFMTKAHGPDSFPAHFSSALRLVWGAGNPSGA